MREISQWSKSPRNALRKSEALQDYVASLETASQQREISRLARLIADVELGLTLLSLVASQEGANSVSALLLGYRFPIDALLNDENWQLIQKARFYLVHRKGRQWEACLNEYIQLPETVRIFRLRDISDVPELIPSSTYPQRLRLYQQTLLTTPPHIKRKVKLATSGYWYAKVSDKGHTPVEVPINIPEVVANLAVSPQISFHRTRNNLNPAQTVTWNELLLSAQEMDKKLQQAGYEPENYHTRLVGVALKVYDASTDNFRSTQLDEEIKLEQLVHIVGLLNVGKSTLLDILIYYFAKQGYRCALLVNDVVAAVRVASLFRDGLGILAAPVLGSSNRSGHLEKVYEPILATQGDEIETGAIHPAWRWFSPVCPLLGLVQSEDKWEFGEEPCHDLYQKQPPPAKNGNSQVEDDEKWDDLEEGETEDKYTCPLYYKCPRHQIERDLATALVWVLTPASFIHTRVPTQVFAEKLTFAEAVYRECDFLFVDEADRVQVQFDEACAPDEVLVDASGNSLLNKLGLKFAAAIYNSDRRNMGAEIVAMAKKANDYAQIATDIFLPRLHSQPTLAEWVGHNPFTGRSLFAHIIRDILETPEDNKPYRKKTRAERSQERLTRINAGLPQAERQRRKEIMQTLEGFIQNPLNPRKGGELSNLALRILGADSEVRALAEVADWLDKWLESLGISITEKSKLVEVTRHIYLAILVAVLNDRLGFLVDNLNALMRSRVLDLHDTSLSLVYSPPSDYLPVMPSSPVGNILGFRYTRDLASKFGGKLEYFRYVGVGRYLLLNFPKLFAVDDWDGPHTVLISGTSYAPGTPTYHIREKPTILLEPASNNDKAGDAGIAESEFFFSPQSHAGEHIALSGKQNGERQKAASEMIKAICHSSEQSKSFLTELFDSLTDKETLDVNKWGDRQRLLLITNSYDEAEWVGSILKPLYRVKDIDGIAILRRDNAPAHLSGIRRGKIRDIRKLPTQIVIAPLMALERGHNILNDQRIAAFGAAIFLSRPMPVPDDWQTTVQQLNNWALEKSSDSSLYAALQKREDALTLTNVENEFYQYAVAKMLELNCRAMSFKQLTPDERTVLCWTQLVSIWQIIGRLVRGGVPCIVHFMDTQFAPKSSNSEPDTEISSLLVGIIKELNVAITAEGKDPWEKTIARSLYSAFFNALKKTKTLHYEL